MRESNNRVPLWCYQWQGHRCTRKLHALKLLAPSMIHLVFLLIISLKWVLMRLCPPWPCQQAGVSVTPSAGRQHHLRSNGPHSSFFLDPIRDPAWRWTRTAFGAANLPSKVAIPWRWRQHHGLLPELVPGRKEGIALGEISHAQSPPCHEEGKEIPCWELWT